MTNQSLSSFANNDHEAKQRFEEYKSKDPFPDIIPALLNSADIYDYVALTGMIYPFESRKLKSASYAVPILGKVVYWDDHNSKQVQTIDRDEEFTLRPNSIAFVTLEPMLRLPDYIAFRFNLKITNVYRGILLGTGPLVDPGFVGKLSIPLHNLTTNDYKFTGGEDLIWMEFTKISSNPRWNANDVDSISRFGQYIEFPSTKALPDVEGYLRKADQHRSIRSSISEAIENARTSAQAAADSAQRISEEVKSNAEQLKLSVEQRANHIDEKATQLDNRVEEKVREFEKVKTNFSYGALIGAIGLIIALITLFFQVFSLIKEKDDLINNASSQIKSIQKEIDSLKNEIKVLKKQNK
jgi:deoxycytidine triphosphate deaminase